MATEGAGETEDWEVVEEVIESLSLPLAGDFEEHFEDGGEAEFLGKTARFSLAKDLDETTCLRGEFLETRVTKSKRGIQASISVTDKRGSSLSAKSCVWYAIEESFNPHSDLRDYYSECTAFYTAIARSILSSVRVEKRRVEKRTKSGKVANVEIHYHLVFRSEVSVEYKRQTFQVRQYSDGLHGHN
jgi:hypothetical protein